jgi:hypothetical protein
LTRACGAVGTNRLLLRTLSGAKIIFIRVGLLLRDLLVRNAGFGHVERAALHWAWAFRRRHMHGRPRSHPVRDGIVSDLTNASGSRARGSGCLQRAVEVEVYLETEVEVGVIVLWKVTVPLKVEEL